ECDAELGAERPRQLDAHHRPEHLGDERPASHRKSIHGDPADESLAAEVEDDAAGKSQWRLIQHAGDRARSEQVLVELYPDVVEGLRQVIDVVDPALTLQDVRTGVERGLERVVGALLPVAWTRRAGGAPAGRRGRQRERAKGRGI